MILIVTGNGKGKTTSAIGTAIRASGWGKNVAIVFFDKGGSHYGEGNILNFLQYLNFKKDLISDSECILPNIFRFGCERFDEASNKFRFQNTCKDFDQAKAGLQKIKELYNEKYFLIIADEIINCLNLNIIDELDFRDIISECPKNTHLLLTGRNAPDWLIEKADMVSDVQDVKHYFKKGQSAIKGIDY